MAPLVLASASPRRAELLTAAGIPFTVRAANVDESVHDGEAPDAYVRRLALEKATAIRAAPGTLVLGADTVVVVDGHGLGKPQDAHEAAAMLRRLSGRTHDVLTGVALLGGPAPLVAVAATRVEFHALTSDEIGWYVGTGEPWDKAGAYAIQGLASRFVARIEGSYSNVMGLPVDLVYRLLRQAGANALDGVTERG